MAFENEPRTRMNATLAGIDETVASNVRVRAIELFDLNGRRVTSAQRGVTIIRKYMSDGTVRTEKVMKK